MVGGQRLVEKNFHRHALDDFDVIAGRVFRRQQAECRAAASLNAVHVRAQRFAERVNLHERRLAGLHFFQLRFLKVRHDPDVRRHDGHQLLAHLNVIARLDRLACHAPVAQRENFGVRKVQLRRCDIRLRRLPLGQGHCNGGSGRRQGCPGLVHLRIIHSNLLSGRVQICLRLEICRLRGIEFALRNGVLFPQILRAVKIHLRPFRGRLGGVGIGLRLPDGGFGGGHLGAHQLVTSQKCLVIG